MIRFLSVCVAASVVLTGCVPPTALNAHVTVSGGGSIATVTDTRIVLPNTPMKLNFVTAVSPTCGPSADPAPEVSVITPPAHGTVNIVNDYGYPTFPISSAFYHCDTVKVLGQLVVYTPATNYAGPDYTSVKLYFSNGKEVISDINFNVGG